MIDKAHEKAVFNAAEYIGWSRTVSDTAFSLVASTLQSKTDLV